MQFSRNVHRMILLLVCLSLGSLAHATIWNVDAVLDGGDGGFGFSGFHDASDSTPMSGPELTAITGSGGIGTFNDITGELIITVGLSIGGTADISGFLDFSAGFGFLVTNSELDIDFGTPTGTLVDMMLTFEDGGVCCTSAGSDRPNSFVLGGPGDALITLWGANGYNATTGYYDTGNTVGMDLRLQLTRQVPEPAIIVLLTLGLAGLGFSRRKVST